MFCLPPAGSSASIYHPWKKQISDNIRIIPIEYSGHGIKINEPLIEFFGMCWLVWVENENDSV
jgi:surfactin synthase thioesterase subunit